MGVVGLSYAHRCLFPVSFPPHSLINGIHCASLNTKLLQVTLLHSLHYRIIYNPFLTFICCLTLVVLNTIEIDPKTS